MKKITLVGCGNIGSRHLQGLVKVQYPLDITIIDPNKNSQSLAKSRLEEVHFDKSKFNLVWDESTSDSGPSDLVILATPSPKRVDLVKSLLESGNRRFLVEKMACQSEDEYSKLLLMTRKYNAKIWVNTPRRSFRSYQELKKKVQNCKLLHMIVNAGNIGLGSNAIHFIDLFSWFTEDPKVILEGDYLFNQIFPNKHGTEFVEFAGTIIGHNKNGSKILLNFLPINDHPLTVSFFGKDLTLIVDESNEKIYDLKNPKSELTFETEFQSSLTTRIADDIFTEDNCKLPSLEDSYIAHKELFRIFNNHIKKLTNERKMLCPIT